MSRIYIDLSKCPTSCFFCSKQFTTKEEIVDYNLGPATVEAHQECIDKRLERKKEESK